MDFSLLKLFLKHVQNFQMDPLILPISWVSALQHQKGSNPRSLKTPLFDLHNFINAALLVLGIINIICLILLLTYIFECEHDFTIQFWNRNRNVSKSILYHTLKLNARSNLLYLTQSDVRRWSHSQYLCVNIHCHTLPWQRWCNYYAIVPVYIGHVPSLSIWSCPYAFALL